MPREKQLKVTPERWIKGIHPTLKASLMVLVYPVQDKRIVEHCQIVKTGPGGNWNARLPRKGTYMIHHVGISPDNKFDYQLEVV